MDVVKLYYKAGKETTHKGKSGPGLFGLRVHWLSRLRGQKIKD